MLPDPVAHKLVQLLLDATNFRFDGSDLMLGPVGTGSFCKCMTNYLNQTLDLDQTLEKCQKGWFEVKK